MLKRFILPALMFASFIANASIKDSLYTPQIEGTIRPKYEYRTNTDEHRFQIRNARFGVRGKLSKITSYRVEIDLSDEGITRMKSVYIRLQPKDWYRLTFGQHKIPFSTDDLRSPHQRYFANRSFIGKQLTSGLRDIGATLAFYNKDVIPFNFHIGVYNGSGIYDQKPWRKTSSLAYASRLEINPTPNWSFSLALSSKEPIDMRLNMYHGGFFYDKNGFHFDTEFYYKTYENNAYAPTKGFFSFVAYDIFFKNPGNIKKITPLIRYDMMSDNVGYDDYASLREDVARSRITGGFTFSLDKPYLNDIRLNYEHYFFKNGIENTDNKLVLEFVVRF
jgi:hypothetical protein